MKLSTAMVEATFFLLVVTLASAGNIGGVASTKRSSRIRGSHRGAEVFALTPGVDPFDEPFNINPKRCVTGYWHVGCKHDIQLDERRTYRDLVPKEDRVPMTVEVCWNFCKNVSGAQFFGLGRGSECYCTPHFDDDKDYADAVCDQPCDGDTGRMCGGDRLQDIYEMHDCNNLPSMPCKKPPSPIKNAKLFKSSYYTKVEQPCKNAMKGPLDTMKDSLCQIECEEGFYVIENNLKCHEMGDRLEFTWGQLEGYATCTPVSCGEPDLILHAKYPKTEVFYPNTAVYACDLGYSLNASAQGRKQQEVKCLSNSRFDKVETCKPVQCKACPKGEKYPNGAFLEKGVREYMDDCSFNCAEGYTLDQLADGIKEFTITCLYTGEFEEPPTCLPVKCGASPKVVKAHLADAKRDGVAVVFPEVTTYECDKGYSLDGFPHGEKNFELKCGAKGLFSDAQDCKPVLNGNPPKVAHAEYLDRPYVYGEGVTYTCHTGYTFSGKAGEAFTKTLFAGADGNWQGAPPVCKPIECGSSPSIDQSSVNGSAPATLNFESEPLPYVCKPGYSTVVGDNIWEPAQNHFMVSCLANGEFSKKACVNIDDCLIRNCGNHGNCKDLPSPTGVPLDDYTCECESGYETTLHNSIIRPGALMKRCTDINDCPTPLDQACGGRNAKNVARGECADLINAYKCECGSGYKVIGSPNQTCSPVACGTVSAIDKTTCSPDMVGQEAHYDTEDWTFSCKPGYSLTGAKDGAKNFKMTCKSDGAFSPSAACEPVSCGAPKMVGNADMLPERAKLVYLEHVQYTCDEGYALKGDAKGLRVFQIDCLESGDFSTPDDSPGGGPIIEVPKEEAGGQPKLGTNTTTTTPMACLPVICGTVPVQEHAKYNETEIFVYPQAANIQCDEGYSIDGSAAPDKDEYKARCQSDGSFKITQACQKVQCLDMQEIPHSSHEPKGPYTYMDKVKFEMEPGYSTDDPSVGRINGTFECTCGANGKFNGTCGHEVKTTPIDCGTAPEVVHATVTGSTLYTGKLVAVADTGFSLDGTAEGQKEFTFYCKADGRFSARQEFQPIECGLCAEYANVESVGFVPAAHSITFLQLNRSALKRGKRLNRAFYNDQVDYLCDEGFRATSGLGEVLLPIAPVTPEHPQEFKIICTATGDFKMVGELPADTMCVPITCDVKDAGAEDTRIPYLPGGLARLQYQELQPFNCKAGFSTNGKPSGDTTFTEACTSSGGLSATNNCVDIDWCLVSKCGENGKCVDGNLAYSCVCDKGYQVTMLEAAWETCTNILECETQNGLAACSVGGGKCNDKILAYSCECPSGYENKVNDAGLDSCSPVLCPAAPVLDHAASEVQGQKMSYPQATLYTCDSGYTLDASATGNTVFEVKCAADAALAGVKSCEAVKCPAAPEVENAIIDGDKESAYGRSVSYMCNFGYTTTGDLGAASSFDVPCLAHGELAASQACLPVKCGAPPILTQAEIGIFKAAAAVYKDKIEYTCGEGYTLDGKAAGEKSIEVSCEADGTFKGMQACLAVECGMFDGVEHGQSPVNKFAYPAQFSVVCDAGYTVDADPDGESTFVVKCGATGKFEGVGECKPVSCGEPAGTGASTAASGEKSFTEVAEWTCKPGYSTNGKIKGPTSFKKQCEASGSFGKASPSDCVDIDFCGDSPCTRNGICSDAGVGVPFPGYSCSCHEGFEVKKHADGSEKCSADDCAGSPCGDGGTCTDLSKVGGADGSWGCECQDGYKLHVLAHGPTCKRTLCGVLPNVDNTTKHGGHFYSVKTWKGDDAPIEDGKYLLKSFDVATLICEEGYSTDGRTTPEGKSFSVTCSSSGLLSRALKSDKECQPIVCDDPFLPSIQNADVTNKEGVFAFGMEAEFTCKKGHSLTGNKEVDVSFRLTCQADGRFESTKNKCMPIACPVPEMPNADASKKDVVFGESVIYACKSGYAVGGLVGAEHASMLGRCESNSNIVFGGASGAGCTPMKCGAIPAQPHAVEVPPRAVWAVDACPTMNASQVVKENTHLAVRCCSDDGKKCETASLGCFKGTFTDAQTHCNRNSMRLCSMTEHTSGICCRTGCELNGQLVWTSDLEGFPLNKDWFGQQVFITGHRGESLQDANGTVKVHSDKQSSEKWVITDAGDGKVFITSNRGEHLKDQTGIVEMSTNKAGRQMFSLTDAGDGKVFITSNRYNQIQDASGTVKYTSDKKSSEQWTITRAASFLQVRRGNASAAAASASAVLSLDASSMEFGDVVKYRCSSDMTLGGLMGGDEEYEVSCGADGKLTGGIPSKEGIAAVGGPPLDKGLCQDVQIAVRGEVTDATDGSIKLADVKVTFIKDGKEVATVFSNAAGIYSARLEAGRYTFKAVKSGFIDNEKGPVSISTPISPGQNADMSLSKPLGTDGWRVVLNWGEMKDLDSHMYFGCDLSQHTSHSSRLGTSERGGGLRVSLDRDDTDGFGPETTTIVGAGKCEEVGCCLLQFKVNRFSKDETLAKSGGIVTLYHGAAKVQKYTVPACLAADEDWWTVFTIDASTGENKEYEGLKLRAPYVKVADMGTKSWALAMDSARWSTVETVATDLPALISGLKLQDRTKLHLLDAAKFYDLKGGRRAVECKDVSWDSKLGKEQWALCPAGYYLSGLYRTGTKYDDKEGIEQLNQGRCCKPKDNKDEWGICKEQSFNQASEWKECGAIDGKALIMVGLKSTLVAGTPPPPAAYAGPKALHGTTGSGIFLGGTYIELGFRTNSDVGKMGADGDPPSGFFKRFNRGGSGVGMLADPVGFKNDPTFGQIIDYFLPGSPEESFWAGYKIGGSASLCNNCGSKVEDTSKGDATASALTTAVVGGNLRVVQDISLGVNDKYFKNVITLKNVGGASLSNVRFMRSHDPDNTVDQGGSYQTNQKLEATVGRDGYAAVSATSQAFDTYYSRSGGKQAIVMYYSDDPRAKATFGLGGLRPSDIYDPRVYDAPANRGETISTDAYISICFDVGTLAPGTETTMTYYTALDSRPISEVVAEVIAAAKPVLTLTEMKCCALPSAGLWAPVEAACPAM
mmetsp:Transcript_58452/g.153017  ORF Transcript_58452/g.153017 Transcript_58452/m.153017 type:complete len:3030 (+) Transcript_58452:146-9235(+)